MVYTFHFLQKCKVCIKVVEFKTTTTTRKRFSIQYLAYPMERALHTWKQSSLVLTTVTVVLLCFMETPKIILLTEAIISKWTCIRCLRLFRVVEVGLRGFPLVSTTVLGIRVFVINSDRNLSIECSVSGSIFDRFVRT